MNEQIRLILLDGSKGAGKTTVSDILRTRLREMVFLSIDEEKHALPNQERTRTELYREAFEVVFKKIEDHLEGGLSVVVDCGLTGERASRLENLARSKNVRIYRFFLDASYEVLLERVRVRDRSRGKQTDEKRFEEVFQIIHSKDLSAVQIIDTSILTSEEVADRVITALTP